MATQPSQNPTRPEWLDDSDWPFPVHSVSTPVGRVAYTDVGSGPVLLLVHAGFWSFVWRDLIRELMPNFRCVTLDPPGSGLTGGGSDVDLRTAAMAVDGLVAALELDDITLVVHDLGGPAALEAAARWPERVRAIAGVNTFAWKPTGRVLVGMLGLMGSDVVRVVDAFTGILPLATSSRFGVGLHLDRRSRRAFRRGVGRVGRESQHRYMGSARTHDYRRIDECVSVLADRPVLTVFGSRNDPFRFQRQWRNRFPHIEQIQVPKGNHFPMCDDPAGLATQITAWYRSRVAE